MARRVRIVEDNVDVAYMLGAALALDAPDLDVAFTTTAFDQLLQPEPWEGVDVAVCDLMLPGVDGQTILRYLRDTKPTIRRVAMTAALAEGVHVTGLADQVLIKPFASADLLDAIR